MSWSSWDSPDQGRPLVEGHTRPQQSSHECVCVCVLDANASGRSFTMTLCDSSCTSLILNKPLQTSHQWFSVTLQLNYASYCSGCSWSSFFCSHSCCSFFHHVLLGFHCRSFTLWTIRFFHTDLVFLSHTIFYSPAVVWWIVDQAKGLLNCKDGAVVCGMPSVALLILWFLCLSLLILDCDTSLVYYILMRRSHLLNLMPSSAYTPPDVPICSSVVESTILMRNFRN